MLDKKQTINVYRIRIWKDEEARRMLVNIITHAHTFTNDCIYKDLMMAAKTNRREPLQ